MSIYLCSLLLKIPKYEMTIIISHTKVAFRILVCVVEGNVEIKESDLVSSKWVILNSEELKSCSLSGIRNGARVSGCVLVGGKLGYFVGWNWWFGAVRFHMQVSSSASQSGRYHSSYLDPIIRNVPEPNNLQVLSVNFHVLISY